MDASTCTAPPRTAAFEESVDRVMAAVLPSVSKRAPPRAIAVLCETVLSSTVIVVSDK